jgi:hypothetical protein
MNILARAVFALLFTVFATGVAVAGDVGGHHDAKAVELLNRMGTYTASMDRFVISGDTHADARLDAGLLVSNSTEVEVYVDRPGSMYIKTFDGVTTKKIYIYDGQLTVFSSEQNFYAQAGVPEAIDEALHFALEQFDVEAPLMDLIFSDASIHLLTEQETIVYLTDKSRIRGVDCHHIAVRGLEIDLQIWIEEGDRPVPRKVLMTSKWEGGSPRHVAYLDWNPQTDLDPAVFEFKAPDNSMEIEFLDSP